MRNLSYSKFEILKEQFKKECNEDEEGKVDEEQFEKMIRDIFGMYLKTYSVKFVTLLFLFV